MKFIAKGKAQVRFQGDDSGVQCSRILKNKGADLLVGDGILVARYDAVRLVGGVEKNVVIEEIISHPFSLVLDPNDSPYAADWPSPAKARPKFVPNAAKPEGTKHEAVTPKG